jgi:hypothetical protein
MRWISARSFTAGIRSQLCPSVAGPGSLLTLLDTSLLVAALTNEPETGRMQAWLGEQGLGRRAISAGVFTEFRPFHETADRTDRGRSSCGGPGDVLSAKHEQLHHSGYIGLAIPHRRPLADHTPPGGGRTKEYRRAK